MHLRNQGSFSSLPITHGKERKKWLTRVIRRFKIIWLLLKRGSDALKMLSRAFPG
jgi:hypothetical protein